MSSRHEGRDSEGSARRLVSLGRPCPSWSPRLTDLVAEFESQVFFSEPGENRSVLGLGAAHILESHAKSRFEDVKKEGEALFTGAIVSGAGRGPLLLGGFAFTPQYLSDRVWQGFPPACFLLPHFQLERVDSGCTLRINVWAEAGEDLQEVTAACGQALDIFQEQYLEDSVENTPRADDASLRPVQVSEPVSKTDWELAVGRALDLIDSEEIAKIVLARVQELRSEDGFDLGRALETLLADYGDCYVYLFRRGRENAFLGASPELLCKAEGTRTCLTALAGTAPRSCDSERDRLARESLMASPKERREHEVVVKSLLESVDCMEATAAAPREPRILSLRNVHHLFSPISVSGSQAMHVLDWVELLHPTPALGGEPRAASLEWIDKLESWPRGWYGAPFGVFDSRAQGTFAVAIRSAAVSGRRAWLFAGAGVVKGSQPDREWQETEWKLRPMQAALSRETERSPLA